MNLNQFRVNSNRVSKVLRKNPPLFTQKMMCHFTSHSGLLAVTQHEQLSHQALRPSSLSARGHGLMKDWLLLLHFRGSKGSWTKQCRWMEMLRHRDTSLTQ